ncbi:MAG: MFS transporter [Burkholderiaceae bacterium]|nr:MAG: MFS transporter [Burkholderiaceae bacterium]TBR76903.1 MAG: MFS transporter [Burkholderiaceae bacterium]
MPSASHASPPVASTTSARPQNPPGSHGARDHASVKPADIAVGVIIGRASEYFDFFVFGIACVLVFPAVFFPFVDRLDGTLLAFVLLSFAFIARPFGTVAFMAAERRWGRSVKLTAALFILGGTTAAIAFLPGYNALGFAAIALLAALRICQGLALGGTWDGLPSLLALNAPPRRRGWYAMVPQLGAPIGFIFAAVLFLFLYDSLKLADFLDWGWRYPFFVAFAINVVALFARLRLVATPEYEQMLQKAQLAPAPVGELIRERGANVVIGAFAALASYALFHLVTIFPLSWITLRSMQPVHDVLTIQIIGAVIAIAGVIASGSIADRFGRRNTLGTIAALIGIFSLFAPLLLDGSSVQHDVFILIGFALLGLSYGQAAGAVTANFSAQYRYTGAALTSDLAWLIGAAFAPLVVLGLSAHFGLAYVSVYLLSGVICTLAALRINRALELQG